MEEQGIHSAREYAKKFHRPGAGTVERYMTEDQDPITTTGTWRSAPQRIAESLNIAVEVLFPDAAERRQQLLDEQSLQEERVGIQMTLLQCVRCPKTEDENGRAIFVMVDLTCASCPYKEDLGPEGLVCNHPRAKDM
jgi:hypothetical protein